MRLTEFRRKHPRFSHNEVSPNVQQAEALSFPDESRMFAPSANVCLMERTVFSKLYASFITKYPKRL
jgi:hypothetical protein